MIRRISCGVVTMALALGTTTVLGCGGKVDEGDLFPSRSGTTVATFGDTPVSPLYFNETNRLHLGQGPTLAGMNLMAAAQVQLEVATADGSALRYELYRVRKDKTTELLAPVDARSGWDLETFEASSDDLFVVWFPQVDHQERDVAIKLECQSGEGRCAPTRQPGESCAPGFACDEGLACLLPLGHCDPWVTTGVCGHREEFASLCTTSATPPMK